ncbi:MAG: hypothetical protein Q9169_003525 [Polycauliona sp. 2 TL-2023]
MTDNTATPAEGTPQTPRRSATRSGDQAIARTERVPTSHPAAPVRRYSASDVTRQATAPFEQPIPGNESRGTGHQGGDASLVGAFGLPAPINHHNTHPDATASQSELSSIASQSSSPHVTKKWKGKEREVIDCGTVRFVDDLDGVAASNTEQFNASSSKQFESASALHSPTSADNGLLLRHLTTTGAYNASNAQKTKDNLGLTQPQRGTIIHGHKAGIWLYDDTWKSFSRVANSVLQGQWDDLGNVPKMVGYQSIDFLEITVSIKDGNKQAKNVDIKLFSKARKEVAKFEKHILPVLRMDEPKPSIQVRREKRNCGCEDKKEESCENSSILKVNVPDVGFLRVLAKWHLWREPPNLYRNDLTFNNEVMRLLFPSANGADAYRIELPDGRTFSVSGNAPPFLTAEVQEALSEITTAESKPGDKSAKITLNPCPSDQTVVLEAPATSPKRRSPGLAKAEGAMFVYRPANWTHFQYDPPYKMENFLKLARKELYPNTEGKLKLRISPSEAFRKEGKLLLPISDSSHPYDTPGVDGISLEDVWRIDIVEKWLRPQEDVWVIKVFDSIRVYNGLRENDPGHQPEQWDLSAMRSLDSDNANVQGWNIPPKSIMDGLAQLSLNLLDIDPRKSITGITIRVKREGPSEWLRWDTSMEFPQFMLDILYKVDGEAISIYPGAYVEPDDDAIRIARAIKNMPRRRRIAKDAYDMVDQPEDQREIVGQDGPLIKDHQRRTGIPQSQTGTVWDPTGKHLVSTLEPTYTASYVGKLRQDLNRAQSEILGREESCRVCGLTFLKRSGGVDLDRTKEIEDHYASHVKGGPRMCSFPGCGEDLGDPTKCKDWSHFNEHLILHPNTSHIRTQIPEPPPRRDSATQTAGLRSLATRPTGENNRYLCTISKRAQELAAKRAEKRKARRAREREAKLAAGEKIDEAEEKRKNKEEDKKEEEEEYQATLIQAEIIPLEVNDEFKAIQYHPELHRYVSVSPGPTIGWEVASPPSRSQRTRGAPTKKPKAKGAARNATKAVDGSASTKVSGKGKGKDKAAASKAVEPFMDQKILDSMSAAAAKAAKGQRIKLTMKPESATQSSTLDPQNTAPPGPSGPTSSITGRQRATRANPIDPETPEDATLALPATRKTRTQAALPEAEPTTTRPPDPPKTTRASRAKKGQDPPKTSQAETSSSAATAAASTDPPSTALPPPTIETTSAETPAPAQATTPPRTRRTRGTTAAASSAATTTSPAKKRKATTTAPSKSTSPAKKPKLATVEKEGDEVEPEPTAATGNLDTAAREAGIADTDAEDNDNEPTSPVNKGRGKGKGKGKGKAAKAPTKHQPAAPATETRSSLRKRNIAATAPNEPTTTLPAGKKRKVATALGGVGVGSSSAAAVGGSVDGGIAEAVTGGVTGGGVVMATGITADIPATTGEHQTEPTVSAATANKRKRTPTPKAAVAAAGADEQEEEEEEEEKEGKDNQDAPK